MDQPDETENHSPPWVEPPRGRWHAPDEVIGPGSLLFGRRRVIRKLGAGGMGDVWLVRLEDLGCERALKRIVSGIAAHPQARARFRAEARTMASISHPNVVVLHDAALGEDGGEAYIEMEYVRGRPMDRVLRPGSAMPLDWSARLVLQLCDALDAVHARGIVHRDLKPSNLMLLDGRPTGREWLKVLDFGIAKALRPGAEDGTATRGFVGSYPYAPPEQIEGHAEVASDLYAAGVLLYQMLTGHRPFAGPREQVVHDHVHTPPPPFSAVRPDLRFPPAVEALVLRCLAKDPADRPRSAAELAEALEAALRADPPSTLLVAPGAAPTPDEPTPNPPPKPAQARARRLDRAMVAALALAAIASSTALILRPDLRGEPPAPTTLTQAPPGQAREPERPAPGPPIPPTAPEPGPTPGPPPSGLSDAQAVRSPVAPTEPASTESVPEPPAPAAPMPADKAAGPTPEATPPPTPPAPSMTPEPTVAPAPTPGPALTAPIVEPPAAPIAGPPGATPAPPAGPAMAPDAAVAPSPTPEPRPAPAPAAPAPVEPLPELPPDAAVPSDAAIAPASTAPVVAPPTVPGPKPPESRDRVRNAFGMAMVRVPATPSASWYFYMSVHEVTQGVYEKVMGVNPSVLPDSGRHPVTNVSWLDALKFCNALSVGDGREPYYEVGEDEVGVVGGGGYRLPTEAEWEYACCQGEGSLYSFGNGVHALGRNAWYRGNSRPMGNDRDIANAPVPHEVGRKAANRLGLFDMHGNVAEWCWDASGQGKGRRAIKGGSFDDEPPLLRATLHLGEPWDVRDLRIGFRVARDASAGDRPRTGRPIAVERFRGP